jgi:hypothetical protein
MGWRIPAGVKKNWIGRGWIHSSVGDTYCEQGEIHVEDKMSGQR